MRALQGMSGRVKTVRSLRADAVMGLLLIVLLCGVWHPAVVHAASPALPRIAPAPEFTLLDQSGRRVTARQWRGKVLVVTFVFAGCSQTCPALTAKLVAIQRQLGAGTDVHFAAITVDPLNDTPEVLNQYARAYGADPRRFSFLTGSMNEIDDITRRYAVYRKADGGVGVDHTFLTSLVDRDGVLRVQYLGTRFDPREFLADVQALRAERPRP